MSFLTFFGYFTICFLIFQVLFMVFTVLYQKYQINKFKKDIKNGKIKVITLEQSEDADGNQTWN